jgi:hypothetical protein
VIALAARLLENKAARGVLLSVSILIAVGAAYRLGAWTGDRSGYSRGKTEATAAAQADALTAKAVSDSAWAVLYAQAAQARDAERAALARVARAEARTRIATARLDDALSAYRVDTISHTPACSELADSCANAASLWGHERDTLTALIAAQDTTILRQSDMLTHEPQRMQDALRVALAQQRQTFRAPSRATWAFLGAIAGAIATVVAR